MSLFLEKIIFCRHFHGNNGVQDDTLERMNFAFANVNVKSEAISGSKEGKVRGRESKDIRVEEVV